MLPQRSGVPVLDALDMSIASAGAFASPRMTIVSECGLAFPAPGRGRPRLALTLQINGNGAAGQTGRD